jgi:hypothetical protein
MDSPSLGCASDQVVGFVRAFHNVRSSLSQNTKFPLMTLETIR